MEEQNAWATGSIQNECASNRPFNYSTIDYFDAVLVYAIMLSSDSACSNGQIGSMSELRLCLTDEPLLDITRRHFRRRIIQFSPSTPLEAIAPRQDNTGRLFVLSNEEIVAEQTTLMVIFSYSFWGT